MADIDVQEIGPMSMHCDNQVVIYIANNLVLDERTKHMKWIVTSCGIVLLVR